MSVYELEDKDGCPNCHHQVSLWLGASGNDHEGMHVAYRCPNCGMETCDYIVGVDDLIPEKFAWVREPDGVVTWYLEERAEHSVNPTNGIQASSQAVSKPEHLSNLEGSL